MDGIELAIFRSGSDLFCVENECPHQHAPLSDGDVAGDVVTCLVHAWEINLRTGVALDAPWMCVRRYPVEARDGGIWVSLTPIEG